MTIFQKIIDKEIPADIVYETSEVLAFRDINPQAPVHVLVIPKKPIISVAHATEPDQHVLGQLLLAAAEVARLEGVLRDGLSACHKQWDQCWADSVSPSCTCIGWSSIILASGIILWHTLFAKSKVSSIGVNAACV